MNTLSSQISITKSNGFTKKGLPVYFVRPGEKCFNRSRRCVGNLEKQESIKRWFSPQVFYYDIEGVVIGSNSKENALREYWRVCDKERINIKVEVSERKISTS